MKILLILIIVLILIGLYLFSKTLLFTELGYKYGFVSCPKYPTGALISDGVAKLSDINNKDLINLYKIQVKYCFSK